MKIRKYLFWLLIVVNNAFSQDSLKKSFSGSWINKEYYNLLASGGEDSLLQAITPRVINIDNLGNLRVETRFEQQVRGIFKPLRKQQHKLVYKYITLTINNENMIEYTHNITGKKKYFTKVSNYFSCLECGIQFLLHNWTWNNYQNWKMISLTGSSADTLNVEIKYGKIRSAANKKLITEFEFADIFRKEFKNQKHFTIVFFRTTSKYQMVDDKLYVIDKIGNDIYLYNEEILSFKFVPLTK